MLDIRNDHLRKIIDKLPEEFDSHKLIEEFRKEYPTEYERLKNPGADPIRTLNSQIAQYLEQNLLILHIDLGNKAGVLEGYSRNSRGKITKNKNWHKI